ncbi:MAG: DUF5916 domain-containing protein, partial [Candidatus Edwardsbacteria bacterium]|nr:DUF5916 domain-containing protein [Candidatus Edwardsbacteria bacterium]
GLKPGRHLELLPCASGRTEHLPGQQNTSGGVGLDAKWAPLPSLAWDAAINPDFAQIEADPSAINLSKYETCLPEKRPFFIERADLFNVSRLTNFNIGPSWQPFYSRRVGKKLPDGHEVPILFGTRLTGKLGSTAVGAIAARTRSVAYEDDGDSFTEPGATYSIFRVRQDIFSNSTVGLYSVNRTIPGVYDGVAVLDVRISSGPLNVAGAGAQSLNSDHVKKGSLGEFNVNWQEQYFQLFAGIKDIGKQFYIKKIGYQADAGNKTWAAGGGIRPDLSRLGLTSFWLGLFYGQDKQYDNDKPGRGGTINLELSTVNAWSVWSGADCNHGCVAGIWRKIASFWLGANSDESQKLSAGFNYSQNDAYNYDRDYFGHTRNLELWSSLSLLPNLSLSLGANRIWQYIESWGFDRAVSTSSERLQYSLNRDVALRLYVQQNTDDHSHSFNGLVSWSFAPGSAAYLAYNETRDNSRGKMEPESRTVVAKVSYLWSL